MNLDILLLITWKRWQKWKMIKQTPKQWTARRRHILRLFGIWKLMVYQKEEAHHRMWVHPIFTEKQRLLQGACNNLVKEMQLEDHEMFYNYCRMSIEMFDQLLHIVGPHIEKRYVIRDPIPARIVYSLFSMPTLFSL